MDARNPVSATAVRYIKLGDGNRLAEQCFRDGTLAVLFREVPSALLDAHDWGAVAAVYAHDGKQTATRRKNELRKFMTEPATTLWLTFHGDHLYWCFAHEAVEHMDGMRQRRVIGAWSNRDINGKPLRKTALHGQLRTTQGYRGTICDVSMAEHALLKINGQTSASVRAALDAAVTMRSALIPMIQSLWAPDFEVFVDQLFRAGGWWHIGEAGGIVADVDLQLYSPLTGEKCVVQIKSTATRGLYDQVQHTLHQYPDYDRRILVCHSPDASLDSIPREALRGELELWDQHRLADQALRMGLVGWLADKAA